jgi:hypothetical protein
MLGARGRHEGAVTAKAAAAIGHRVRVVAVIATAVALVVVLLGPPADASAKRVTFTTPGETQFVVPDGVTSINAFVFGAQGGSFFGTGPGGLGAQAKGTLPVAPGELLYVEVNVLGGDGGRDRDGNLFAGVGGGESDVRTCPAADTCNSPRIPTLASRLLVAGGGGGGGGGDPGPGGNAGTPTPGGTGAGGTGGPVRNAAGGTGATDVGPGTGGLNCDGADNGADGALQGGAGGGGGSSENHIGAPGGGGGGGWFGGGGGGGCAQTNEVGGSGGGGSSHAASDVSGVRFSQAAAGQAPSVTLSYKRTSFCQGQPATLVAGPGSGPVAGTARADVIVGSPGDDPIQGGGGDDLICGGAGDDTISGGSGDDTISGGAGDDTISGGAGDDTISGGAGSNTISGGPGRNDVRP